MVTYSPAAWMKPTVGHLTVARVTDMVTFSFGRVKQQAGRACRSQGLPVVALVVPGAVGGVLELDCCLRAPD